MEAGRHYLVLDTNIILNQIDLLESPGLNNVVILSTVLEEVELQLNKSHYLNTPYHCDLQVRHRSSPVYKRLKDIIADPGRFWYVFVNEHRKETWIERQAGETSNDRNDRAIRVATTW